MIILINVLQASKYIPYLLTYRYIIYCKNCLCFRLNIFKMFQSVSLFDCKVDDQQLPLLKS